MDKDTPNASNGVAGRHTEAKRGFRTRYRRMWLASVFFTAFVSLTPLVIMTFVNYYQYRRTLRAQMIDPIARLTSTSKRFIDDFFREHKSALTYVVTRESYEDLCDPEKCPVWDLHQLYSDEDTLKWVQSGCRSAGIGCIDCKSRMLDAMLAKLDPIRTRGEQLEQNLDYVNQVITEGNEEARDEARDTLEEVRAAIGINY